MKSILEKLNINTTFTKTNRVTKSYNRVKDNIPLIENYNFMADILMLPTATYGYKYLLVIVDLATDKFDIQQLKTKDADTTLKAMLTIFERGILKKPYASIRVDNGSEFKGVFKKYLYDNDILEKVALTNRHTQLANVESLNKQLGIILNGYMSKKELETGETYKNWTDIVSFVRIELNKHRKKKLPDDITTYEYPTFSSLKKNKKNIFSVIEPKFKKGEMVHVMLDFPKNALGQKQSGGMRAGDYRYDTKERKIKHVLYYSGKVKYRYLVDGIDNASYAEWQLMKANKKEVDDYFDHNYW